MLFSVCITRNSENHLYNRLETSQICCLGYEDAHLHFFIHPNQPNYDPNHLKRGHFTKRKVGASVSCGHIFLVFYLFIFFFRCGHGIPWWRWNQDNQLYVKVLKICTRKGWWWWEKRKLNLLLTIYILYAVYEERKYWNEFWSLLFY